MRTTFAALRLRNYRLFATGSLVSNIGTWMQRIAQDWLVLTLTGSAGALGITTGLAIPADPAVLPDRRRAGRSLPEAAHPRRRPRSRWESTAGILGLLAITGWVTVWHVYVIAFLFGIGTAIDTPARQAFVHEMVRRDQLPNAVGLNSASFNLGRVIGPAIAGGLIAAARIGRRRHRVGHHAQRRQLPRGDRLAAAHAPRGAVHHAAGAPFQGPAARRHPLRPRPSRHHARDGRRVLRRHVRAQLPDDDGVDGDRGVRQGRRRVRHPRLGARDRVAHGLTDGGPASGVPPAPRHRCRRGVRARRHRSSG